MLQALQAANDPRQSSNDRLVFGPMNTKVKKGQTLITKPEGSEVRYTKVYDKRARKFKITSENEGSLELGDSVE